MAGKMNEGEKNKEGGLWWCHSSRRCRVLTTACCYRSLDVWKRNFVHSWLDFFHLSDGLWRRFVVIEHMAWCDWIVRDITVCLNHQYNPKWKGGCDRLWRRRTTKILHFDRLWLLHLKKIDLGTFVDNLCDEVLVYFVFFFWAQTENASIARGEVQPPRERRRKTEGTREIMPIHPGPNFPSDTKLLPGVTTRPLTHQTESNYVRSRALHFVPMGTNVDQMGVHGHKM